MGCHSSKKADEVAAPAPKPASASPTLLGSQIVLRKDESVPILAQIRQHAKDGIARAIMESSPEADQPKVISYAELLMSIEEVGRMVVGLLAGRQPGLPKHVAYLVSPGIAYATLQLSVWAAGAVCVPLSVHSPAPELEYFLEDSEAALAVADDTLDFKLRPIAAEMGRSYATITPSEGSGYRLNAAEGSTIANGQVSVSISSNSLILYTSGTTGKPKGVVHTFVSLTSQYSSLIEAWKWSSSDHTLHVLPLHHIHGVQNILNTALFVGATVEFTPFDAGYCLKRLTSGDITCFHAIPTIYTKFSQHLDKMTPEAKAEVCRGLRSAGMRYMISGSAALALSTMRSWAEISGHVLLERYGMTETGMALSNELNGTRYPGCVGWPLPKVQVKQDSDGSILVKGGPVFKEYYRRPDETQQEFTNDGWFRTGDNAQVGGTHEELQALRNAAREMQLATGCPKEEVSTDSDVALDGIYKILGRSSVDIIKSGGYKISALEIELELMQHEAIRDCAVIGKPDETWGEKVTAVCVLNGTLTLEDLRRWGKVRLATYKVPQELEVVQELPRNQMGKVEKSRLLERYGAGAAALRNQTLKMQVSI